MSQKCILSILSLSLSLSYSCSKAGEPTVPATTLQGTEQAAPSEETIVDDKGLYATRLPARDPQIQASLNLMSTTTVPGTRSPANLIRSQVAGSQSYLYDNALAVMALSKAGEKAAAQKILNALANIQNPSFGSLTVPDAAGSWYFSYNLNGTSIYPGSTGAYKMVSGANAWVVMAINTYYLAFQDSSYNEVARRNLDYLRSFMDRREVSFNGASSHPLPFSPNQTSTGWDESAVYSLEHNLDAYSAFRYYAINTAASNPSYAASAQASADELRRFLESLWTVDHFYAGYDASGVGGPNQSEHYLDTQTWGLLALGKTSSDGRIDFRKGLAFDCSKFYVSGIRFNGKTGIFGFFDSLPSSGVNPYTPFVWSEGTMGYSLAMKLVSLGTTPYLCRSANADAFMQSVAMMADSTGTVAYSTTSNNPDFTTAAGVAGTAWYYFGKISFNPFQPDKPLK